MRVGSSQRASYSGGASGAPRSTGASGGFSIVASDAPARADQAQSSQRVVSIGTVLAVQTIGDTLSGRRRAVAHGNKVLDLLERIKVELLSGPVTDGQKERLEEALDAGESELPSEDHGLRETLVEIDLRARVELAKLASRNR